MHQFGTVPPLVRSLLSQDGTLYVLLGNPHLLAHTPAVLVRNTSGSQLEDVHEKSAACSRGCVEDSCEPAQLVCNCVCQEHLFRCSTCSSCSVCRWQTAEAERVSPSGRAFFESSVPSWLGSGLSVHGTVPIQIGTNRPIPAVLEENLFDFQPAPCSLRIVSLDTCDPWCLHLCDMEALCVQDFLLQLHDRDFLEVL